MNVFEDVLELPSDLVEKWTGMSFDIGGSGAKLIYRSKEDYKNGKPLFSDTPDEGRVRLALCSQEQIEELIEFVLQNCDITSQNDEVPVLTGTGVGSQIYKDKLEKALNVTITVKTEFDCIVHGARYLLDNQPKDKVLREFSQEGMRDAKPEVDAMLQSLKNMLEHTEGDSPKATIDLLTETDDGKLKVNIPLEDPVTNYPCFLLLLGSTTCFLQLNADGTFKLVDGCYYGARAFQGLGSLTVGTKSFAELITLAEKGDHRNVDYMTDDMNKAAGVDETTGKTAVTGDENLYTVTPSGIMLFVHGKAVNKSRDDFKREDIAASLLNGMCAQLSLGIHLCALHYKIPRVYIVGNFVSPAVIQRYLSKQLLLRISWHADKPPVKMCFMRAGGHLGAIGAFLKSVGQ